MTLLWIVLIGAIVGISLYSARRRESTEETGNAGTWIFFDSSSGVDGGGVDCGHHATGTHDGGHCGDFGHGFDGGHVDCGGGHH